MLQRALKYILLLIIFIPVLSYGQRNSISYNRLDPSSGLSHITVNSLYQDSNEAIWIATRDGLNCYDGSAVRVFRKDKNNPKSLASSNIAHIEGDGKDRLFLSCNDGVWMLDIPTEEFSLILEGQVDAILWSDALYIATDTTILKWNEAEAIFEHYYSVEGENVEISALRFDSTGRLWIGTDADGLYVRELDGSLRSVIPSASVVSIFESKDGYIWVGTSTRGLYRISEGEVKQFEHDKDDSNSLSSNFVRAITQDRLGRIWLATDRGLSCYLPEEGQFESYQNEDNNSSLWPIITDVQGNIWFGSYFGGVSWFNPEDRIFARYNMISAYRDMLEGTVIGRMVEDKDGQLWISTEGSSVYIYDRKRGNLRQLTDRDGEPLVGENIKSIHYDSQNDVMWFGSHLEGLYRYDMISGNVENYRYDPKQQWSLPSNIIRDIVPYGDKLILATPNGVALFEPKTGNSERLFIDTPQGRRIAPVSNLLIDSRNILWIGTEGSGVFTYNFEDRELTNYREGDDSGLSSNSISTIMEDSRGLVWIGHEGSGFDCFSSEDSSFTNYDTRSAGIVGNRIYEICDNLDGTLSVLTGEGLSLFDVGTLESYNYSPQSGYTILSPNENAMYRTQDGMIFIGGVDGLISLDVESLRNIEHRGYKLHFNSLYVNQRLVSPNDQSNILPKILTDLSQVVLPSYTSSFSVGFATTNYILELNEPLEFYLEGFDSEWMPVHGEVISYTNIPAGNYTLHLRAASMRDSVESATLDIRIKSEWYKSRVAKLIYLLLIALTIYYLNLFYRQRVRLSEQVRYEQSRVLDIENQNRQKLQFFTNISHEFRTPLSVIIGQIDLLLGSKQLSGESRNRVQSIHRSSSELNLLIGELLDFRKHEQGRLSLDVNEANISGMISELSDIYSDYIASRGVNFRLKRTDEESPVILNCDVMQLRKVVTNLLSNAIKYTSKGDLITLTLESDSESVTISVEDTGVGIPASDMHHIFDRFYQGKNSKSSSIGGTGIGLSFAKSIVDLHGGAISVDSRLGSGTWFVVKIPRNLTPAEQDEAIIIPEQNYSVVEQSVEYSHSPLLAGRKNRVTMLVVEDDPQLLQVLNDIFSGQYSVITAINGREGVDMAYEHLPQIIVSDVMMPEVSGIELCRELKADLRTSHIPIVLLTARGATEHAIEGINCGADDYIVKPFSVELMLARCNNIINNRAILQEKYSQQPEENTYKMATSALDQQVLERAIEIIDKHIDNTEFDIATFASEIAMSRTNLFNKIKAVTGLTPNDFILTVRLKRAATTLLSNRTLPIVEVAESVGFNGHRYFSKRFKERFGVTPAAYRKQHEAESK